VRVADLFELGQRLPPGVVRRAGVSGGVVDVAEMGEVFGRVATQAQLAGDAQRRLEAVDRMLMPAGLMVNVSETVPGVGLPDTVVEFL